MRHPEPEPEPEPESERELEADSMTVPAPTGSDTARMPTNAPVTREARPLDWTRERATWPLAAHSRFVAAGGIDWHVQVLGDGAPVLLLHGTGASAHSWRAVAVRLATRHRVVVPDLPGHGFTPRGRGDAMGLPGMAARLAALLEAIGVRPVLAAGHSAGAAVLVRMAIDGRLAPRAIASVNGAFVPFGGLQRALSPVARLLAATPLAARVAAHRARDPRALRRLLESTGSTLDAEGRALYARLVQSPGHVGGALAMMAAWELEPLWRDLPSLRVPLALLVGTADGTVPPAQSDAVAARVAGARVVRLEGLGHLAHEEDPERTAAILEDLVR